MSHVFAARSRVKEHLFGVRVEAEVRSNFSFSQGWFFFRETSPPLSVGLLGIFTLLELIFFSNHCMLTGLVLLYQE